MIGGPHRIRRIVYDLRVRPEGGLSPFAVRQRVESLTEAAVLPALEAVFSRMAPPDAIWRIGRLDVDLGRIDPNHLARELPGRIAERIAATLAERSAAFPVPKPVMDAGGPDANGRSRLQPDRQAIAALDRAEFLREGLTVFLETGVLPWWAGDLAQVPLDLVMAEWMDLAPEAAGRLLPDVLSGATARRRFVRQFGEPMRARLIRLARPDLADAIAAWHGRLSRLLESGGRPEPPAAPSAEAAWDLVLEIVARMPAASEDALAEAVDEHLARLTGRSAADHRSIRMLQGNPPPTADTVEGRAVRETAPAQPADSQRISGPEPASAPPGSDPDQQVSTPWPWRRPGGLEPVSEVYVENAGVVLLWPYLHRFFQTLGLFDKAGFRDPAARARAVHRVQLLATGSSGAPEHRLALCKVLCGWDMDEPLSPDIAPTPDEIRETGDLLTALIGHWTALGRTSAAGLRDAFLKREGRLSRSASGFRLTVERLAHDVLLERLPWGISQIRLSWMTDPLCVEW